MCKRRSQVRHVVEKKDAGAVRRRQPERIRIKENKSNTRQKGKIRFAEASVTFL